MRLPRKTSIALAAAFALGVVHPASAQHAGNGYLFHEPQVRLSFRMGYDRANANSDVFDDATTNLTLNKKDFSGMTLGAEAAFALSSRVDLSVDASYSGAKSPSEFRHFEDNNNLPIEQTTTFQRVPLTASLRFYLTSPGRNVGRLAWIPNKVVPWVGGGGGMMWYRFRQEGDFVDFRTLNVFRSNIMAEDWTQTAHAMAGMDISLSPLVALRAESRYVWARAPLSSAFSGFDRIDLSGVQATLGVTFRL